MEASPETPSTIDEYIAGFSPEVQAILVRIRGTVRAAAPGAKEVISYRMPAFMQDGILVYFAAFKGHVGLYPPVRGDAALEKVLAPYAGEKGNLRFPLAEPIPLDLIERIVKHRLAQNAAKKAAKGTKKKAADATPKATKKKAADATPKATKKKAADATPKATKKKTADATPKATKKRA